MVADSVRDPRSLDFLWLPKRAPEVSGKCFLRALFEARPGGPHTPEIVNFWGRPGYYVVYPGTR